MVGLGRGRSGGIWGIDVHLDTGEILAIRDTPPGSGCGQLLDLTRSQNGDREGVAGFQGGQSSRFLTCV